MGQHVPARLKNQVTSPALGPQRPILQRTAVNTSVHGVPPIVRDVLAAPGQPLDEGTRSALAPRFGHDFGRVRVHTGTRAAESARAVSARAYTVGRHVVFGAEQYAPGTAAGRQLIAHELAHTLQQAGASEPRIGALSIGTPGSAWEQEAEHAARPGLVTALPLTPALAQVQRVPTTDDRLHRPMLEVFRRERGLPPRGVDQSGQPVGPSDAEIKYGNLLLPPPCPIPSATSDPAQDYVRNRCTSWNPAVPAECTLSEEHRGVLASAQRQAHSMMSDALRLIRERPDGRAVAERLAGRLFLYDPPPLDRITEVLERITPLLGGEAIRFEGRSCTQEECHDSSTRAFVDAAGTLPIYVCPLGFAEPDRLFFDIVHETVHLAGIDLDRESRPPHRPTELYCLEHDCETSCHDSMSADAWAHYLVCLSRQEATPIAEPAAAPRQPLLQRAAANTAIGREIAARPVSSVHAVLAEPGQPLDESTRATMEPRFGHDFSRVRLHTSLQAAESARAVSALAYTVGRHVVFGAGQYAPGTGSGQLLLHHELAHVAQQAGAPEPRGGGLSIGAADSAWEREADRAARPGLWPEPRLSPASAQVQRQLMTDDPLHTPVLEDYRHQLGLPGGGVDESGRPVEPSDAEIKYTEPPLCPVVGNSDTGDNLERAACVRGVDANTPAGCTFRPEQVRILRTAQREALGRVRRALQRIRRGPDDRLAAGELADRLFVVNPPSVDWVARVLEQVEHLLSAGDIPFAGRSCSAETCRILSVPAYVSARGALPIYICPLAFFEPDNLYETVLHEALHWAGIDADPYTPELYCGPLDCQTSCLSPDSADAWAHYMRCLGEPITLGSRTSWERARTSVGGVPQ